MTEREAEFVEAMGSYLAGYGMTPMAGRMWGWLLICEPVEQTAADLAEALHASRGAISGTARMLATAGLIHRTRRRGDRREYFSAPQDGLDSLLANSRQVYGQLRRIFDRGLAVVADRPPEIRERMQFARDGVAFIERELPKVLDRYLAEHQAAPEAGKEFVA
jgi:DNA-binding transcriptional regulator GbsR (MarR family)